MDAERGNLGITPAPEELMDAGKLRPLVVDNIRQAIDVYHQENPERREEMKLTILTHWADGEPHILAHASPLPDRPKPPIKVQVHVPSSEVPFLQLYWCIFGPFLLTFAMEAAFTLGHSLH
jgi:hypothetical protein